jgi:hypothetical protein
MERVGSGIRGVFNASGGIGYHLAALRYTSRLWRPFREKLSTELRRRFVDPGQTDLVIIGPSGGYCFDLDLVSEFRSVVAIDIDPIGGKLFEFRLGFSRRKNASGKFRFLRRDFFSDLASSGWKIEKWLEKNSIPRAATFLFSNVLGQLELLYDDTQMAEIDQGLLEVFSSMKNPWVSFHDRFSFEASEPIQFESAFEKRPSSASLAQEWLQHRDLKTRTVSTVHEHELGKWIDRVDGPFRYLTWRLASRHVHLIEVCGS